MNPDFVILSEIIDLKTQVLMLRDQNGKLQQRNKELEAEVVRLTAEEPED